MFDKYLITVLQFLATKQGEFIQVSDILQEAEIPQKYIDSIENELIKKKFVFATEESGVMINDNGLTFLAKQELRSTENILPTNIINSGTVIQGSTINQSSLSVDGDQSKEIRINSNSSASYWLEKLSWIIGILAGLLALYEFVIKRMFLHN